MENNDKNTQLPQSLKTAVISSFFKDVSLEEYFKYGGHVDKIDITKTFTRYGDKNEKQPIEKIEYSHLNTKSNSDIYKVFFKNGIVHEYSSYWISTLVSFRLSESYL